MLAKLIVVFVQVLEQQRNLLQLLATMIYIPNFMKVGFRSVDTFDPLSSTSRVSALLLGTAYLPSTLLLTRLLGYWQLQLTVIISST
jgi:hypothetical protein